MPQVNNPDIYNDSAINKINSVVKKWHIKVVLVVCIILSLVILFNLISNRKIKDVPGVSLDNITSIGLQYNSLKFPHLTVKDPDKIKEIIDFLDGYVVRKKILQPSGGGYYLMAAFYSNDNRVFDILFIGDFMIIHTQDSNGTIKGSQYKIVKGRISNEKLDEFVQSIR